MAQSENNTTLDEKTIMYSSSRRVICRMNHTDCEIVIFLGKIALETDEELRIELTESNSSPMLFNKIKNSFRLLWNE